MSSDEEGNSSPVLPNDSDRGSSVSSDLQDEYEELIRYAVVTPKFEPSVLGPPQPPPELTADGRSSIVVTRVNHQAPGKTSQREGDTSSSETPVSSGQQSPAVLETIEEEVVMQHRPFKSGMALFSPIHSESSDLQGSSGSNVQVTDLPVPSENMKRVEDILDVWSGNLKMNVLTELSKWRLTIIEQHKLQLKRQNECHAAQTSQLSNQITNLKDLLQTYETSVQRKDEVISNLTQAIEKQKEKVSLMRSFTHWRLEHAENRQEFPPHFSSSATGHSQDGLGASIIASATTAGSGIQPTQLPMTRVVASSQQKAGKTITARITGRSEMALKSNRLGNITSLGVSPPMSSVVVEKHHPITQQTISQATAMKYPRPAQPSSAVMSGKSSGLNSRSQHSHVQSIKVMD